MKVMYYIYYIYVFEEKKIHCQICVPPKNSL